MSNTTVIIRSVDDLHANSALFGAFLDVQSKVAVRLEEINEPEQIGNLVADPAKDYILVAPNGRRRPIKKEIFRDTYSRLPDGTYKKTTITQIVQVLEGTTARVITLETPTEENADVVIYPNYIAIGPTGEVYENKATWVADNLEILGAHPV